MTEDDKVKQLVRAEGGKGNSVPVDAAFLLQHRDAFLKCKVPVYRISRNTEGTLLAEPVRLEDIQAEGGDEAHRKHFVIPKDWEARLRPEGEDPLVSKVRMYASLAPEERTKEVMNIRMTLDELKKSDTPPLGKAKLIMDAVEKTFSLNKASLRLSFAEVTQNERTLASETQGIVNSVVGLVENNETIGSLFEVFKTLSNGQTLNHVMRVFSMLTGFLHFYNRIHQLRLGQALRLIFTDHYADYYHQLFPGLEPHLFNADNLVQLPYLTPPEIKKFALGAFLHDIGKMGNLDYFESDAAFNATEIRQHVFLSTGLIIMNYGVEHEEARLMAGDHHNALFHKDGYGVSRYEREKGMRKLASAERCISARADEFITGKALGYLPTEMLAIVDIYDAMTDASRIYKKPMSPAEAVRFMEEKPLAAGKLDPVLMDLFVDFLKEQKADLPEEAGFQFKVRSRHRPGGQA